MFTFSNMVKALKPSDKRLSHYDYDSQQRILNAGGFIMNPSLLKEILTTGDLK